MMRSFSTKEIYVLREDKKDTRLLPFSADKCAIKVIVHYLFFSGNITAHLF